MSSDPHLFSFRYEPAQTEGARATTYVCMAVPDVAASDRDAPPRTRPTLGGVDPYGDSPGASVARSPHWPIGVATQLGALPPATLPSHTRPRIPGTAAILQKFTNATGPGGAWTTTYEGGACVGPQGVLGPCTPTHTPPVGTFYCGVTGSGVAHDGNAYYYTMCETQPRIG
nr:hypothetical protein [Pandoravirus belohorizontensis]